MRQSELTARILADLSDFRHGTPGCYGNHGCRCRKCRDANANYQRDYRHRGRTYTTPIHGTENEYRNHNCRCKACREAATIVARERRKAAS